MKLFLFCCLLSGMSITVYSQQLFSDTPAAQSSLKLNEITVHAYEQNTSLINIPAAIGLISDTLLHMYGNASIVNAVNSLPGVRMEERSPGSYRLAVRGSSLRSPFGVRNVKIYYNDISFTDPGGTTYLNQLGYYNFASIEILKGPGSSLYGAGTGGVVLINSEAEPWTTGAKVEATAGSYGMLNLAGEVRFGKEGTHNTIRYQRLTSDGYRAQTAMQRDVFSWDASSALSKSTKLDAHFLYGNLTYETPGALTLREWDSAPRMARPRAGASPSAEEAGATIYQQTVLAGFSVHQQLSSHWQNTTTFYGVYSQMRNPNIRNYSRTSEPNFGGRSVLKYDGHIQSVQVQWLAGAEFQQNFTTIGTYANRGGEPDTLQTDESVQSRQMTGFTQLTFNFPKGWKLTAGASISALRLSYDLLSSPAYGGQMRNFNNELSPRFALLKKWNNTVSVYGVISRGFSPPASSEMAPSGSALNLDLAPEYGWNYELGARGSFWQQRLSYDAGIYYFGLNHTIVQRRDASSGDYYTNSGNTEQLGAELALTYILLKQGNNSFGDASIQASYTYQYFRYGQFIQIDKDYSGNRLPGVSPHTLSASVSIHSHYGAYLNITYLYNDAFPLNDANTDMNPAYHLLGARAAYELKLKKGCVAELFAGAENLLDVTYSAGPDINAFGGRYYNTSPGRSFFAGISLRYAH